MISYNIWFFNKITIEWGIFDIDKGSVLNTTLITQSNMLLLTNFWNYITIQSFIGYIYWSNFYSSTMWSPNSNYFFLHLLASENFCHLLTIYFLFRFYDLCPIFAQLQYQFLFMSIPNQLFYWYNYTFIIIRLFQTTFLANHRIFVTKSIESVGIYSFSRSRSKKALKRYQFLLRKNLYCNRVLPLIFVNMPYPNSFFF